MFSDYWMAMGTGRELIQAAVTRSLGVPEEMPAGTRKVTR